MKFYSKVGSIYGNFSQYYLEQYPGLPENLYLFVKGSHNVEDTRVFFEDILYRYVKKNFNRALQEGEKLYNDLKTEYEALNTAFEDRDTKAFNDTRDRIFNELQLLQDKVKHFDKLGPQYNKKAADENTKTLAPLVVEAIAHGATTKTAVADYFNKIGKRTRRGREFGPSQIHRLIEKAKEYDLLPNKLPFQKKPRKSSAEQNTPSNE